MRALFIFSDSSPLDRRMGETASVPFSDDHRVLPAQMQIFDGVSGPSGLSTVPPLSPTPVSRYQAAHRIVLPSY
jgi:hypothetical protein